MAWASGPAIRPDHFEGVKVLRAARIVAHFRKRGAPGHALTIASRILRLTRQN